MDFKPFIGRLNDCGRYTFTTRILDGYRLDYIISLCLSYVEVTGEVVGFVLSNCPLIEVLHVKASASLVNLEYSVPLLKLQHLEVLRCFFLKKIEISAINLVSFKYYGRRKLSVRLGDLPNLVEVSVKGVCMFTISLWMVARFQVISFSCLSSRHLK